MRSKYFFFFQAEDGIRDYKVTGVQTCALPIWCRSCGHRAHVRLPPNRDREADAPTRRRGDDVAYGRRPGARRPQGLLHARPAGVAIVGRSVAQVAFSPGAARSAGRLTSYTVQVLHADLGYKF